MCIKKDWGTDSFTALAPDVSVEPFHVNVGFDVCQSVIPFVLVRMCSCLLGMWIMCGQCTRSLVLTLLLSGTRSSLMRRLVPQSLASSSSAISCRWNTATWADRRLTLPLGVRSKSSPWLWFCVAFSLPRPLSFSFSLSLSLGSLSFSLSWTDGAFSCQSFFSGWLCSFLPPDGGSSETIWRSSSGKCGQT